jgi:hypothetical protein
VLGGPKSERRCELRTTATMVARRSGSVSLRERKGGQALKVTRAGEQHFAAKAPSTIYATVQQRASAARAGALGRPAVKAACGQPARGRAARGRGGHHVGAAHRPTGTGPPRYARMAAYRCTAVRRTRERAGARDVAFRRTRQKFRKTFKDIGV